MPPKWLDLQNRRQQRAVDVASGAQENRGDRAAHTGRDGRPDRRHHSRLFDGRYGNRRYGYCLEEKEKGSRTMKKKVGLGLLLAVLACSVCASAFGAAARMRPYTSAATIHSAKKQTERMQKRILSVFSCTEISILVRIRTDFSRPILWRRFVRRSRWRRFRHCRRTSCCRPVRLGRPRHRCRRYLRNRLYRTGVTCRYNFRRID